MIIYIDGFNVLYSKQFNSDKEKQIELLIHQLAKSYSISDSIHVVFDGFPVHISNTPNNITLHFSKSISADDYLIRKINKHKGNEPILLITNDIGLKKRVNSTKVKFSNSESVFKATINDRKVAKKEIPFDSSLMDELLLKRFENK